jgi:hypothetical protein
MGKSVKSRQSSGAVFLIDAKIAPELDRNRAMIAP